jgi:hypothetical protein
MSFDYANARATAARLIDNFGQTVSVVKRAERSGDPWNSQQVFDDAQNPARAVDLGIKERLTPGTLTKRLMRVLYVEAGQVRPVQGDRVVIGDVSHEIAVVMPLSPAGVDVMYEVQVEI